MTKIKFLEKNHRYLTDDNQELISVSKFVERFKQKVDWTLKARSSAARLTKEGTPTTATELLAKWARKRDISATIGTLYHTIREDQLIAEKDTQFYDVRCNKKQCFFDGDVKWALPITELENNIVYPELMIYDTDYMICGQSDKVIVTNNTINIWDYKTDAEITFKGWSSKWQKAAKYLPPVDHLEECNGNTYALKMSLYMYMLWKANKGRFKPGELIIEHVHLKRDLKNDNIAMLDSKGKPIVLKIEKIKLPYLKNEVIAMLETLKPTKNDASSRPKSITTTRTDSKPNVRGTARKIDKRY